NRMTSQLNTTRKGTDALHRIQNFLSTNFECRHEENEISIEPELQQLNSFEFKNLAIGNEEDKILVENINLNLKTGSLVAIVGPSGIGKSTLIRTLLGVQKPLLGSI